MSELKKEFDKLKNYSVKWEKYFPVYENFFSKFKDKKITFVEIGIFNGGSLQMWKNYFGKDSKIIGIDINPECKKFEEKENDIFVETGNQSDDEFWRFFFNKHGNVDAILDDGGHTNLDQIKTTVNTVQHINDGGVLMVEDTHTSYVGEYNSSQKYSFINFSKKVIDDLNSNIDLDLGLKINFSLKKYIYSIDFYESIVCFNINQAKAKKNIKINNKGKNHSIEDLTWQGNEIFIKKFKKYLNNVPFIRLNKFTKFLKKRINNKIIKKYFE